MGYEKASLMDSEVPNEQQPQPQVAPAEPEQKSEVEEKEPASEGVSDH